MKGEAFAKKGCGGKKLTEEKRGWGEKSWKTKYQFRVQCGM